MSNVHVYIVGELSIVGEIFIVGDLSTVNDLLDICIIIRMHLHMYHATMEMKTFMQQ